MPVNVDCDRSAPVAVALSGQPWPNSSICSAEWNQWSKFQYVTPIPLAAFNTTIAPIHSDGNSSVWTYSDVAVGLEPDGIFQVAGGRLLDCKSALEFCLF